MPLLNRSKAFWFVFSAVFLLKIYQLGIPFVEPYNNLTRQSLGASVARNFYENGFNFMNPEINENGRGPYLFNAEMPVGPYLAALGYRLAGGAKEWVARLVSVLFSMAALYLLYRLALLLGESERFALTAVAFMGLSPLSLALSRSVQPEPVMGFATVAALFALARFLQSGSRAAFAASAGFVFLAIGSKFYNAYIFLPLFWLAWERYGARTLRSPWLYGYAAAASTALLWYAYMWRQGQIQQLAYIVYQMVDSRGPADKSFLQLLFSPHYLSITGKVFWLHLLSPMGAVLFVTGLFSTGFSRRADRFRWVWLGSAFALIVVFWRTVIDHSYYQLPLAAPCALFVARGLERWMEAPPLRRFVRPVFLVPFCAAQIFVLAHFYRGIYFIPKPMAAIVAAGRAVQQMTPRDGLVLANYGASPIQLYYCGRKGWVFDLHGEDAGLIEELEKRRAEGAGYFMTSNIPELNARPLFLRHLQQRYRLMRETDALVLYAL